MAKTLSDNAWKILLDRLVKGGKEKKDINEGITPFLGPGIRSESFPKHIELCEKILKKNKYPFGDYYNLPLAAQYAGRIDGMDIMYPKEVIAEEYNNFRLPDDENDPHRILAELPFKIYITTNYDLFMFEALKEQPNKDPKKDVCWWREEGIERKSILDRNPPIDISIANPIVFYILGEISKKNTLVLTEDEYFDFAINISENKNRIPATIQEIITSTPLLFLGYDLMDLEFRVLLRCLKRYYTIGQHNHTSVYVLDENTTDREKAEEFLVEYLKDHKINIHFGNCNEFILELKNRYRKWKRGN